jgi:hypothetical protein
MKNTILTLAIIGSIFQVNAAFASAESDMRKMVDNDPISKVCRNFASNLLLNFSKDTLKVKSSKKDVHVTDLSASEQGNSTVIYCILKNPKQVASACVYVTVKNSTSCEIEGEILTPESSDNF